jgi:hypothetical protein
VGRVAIAPAARQYRDYTRIGTIAKSSGLNVKTSLSVVARALRHTFGTLLSKGGVYPRTAQAAMRHSTIDLTMNTYTDPKLLDVAGALETLPLLPLAGEAESERIVVSATGTDDNRPLLLAPMLAPTPDKPCKLLATVVKMTTEEGATEEADPIAVSGCVVKRKEPLSTADNGSSKSGRLDLNQRPLRPEKTVQPAAKTALRSDDFVTYVKVARYCRPMQTMTNYSDFSW